MFKKIVVMLIILIMLLCFAACGPDKDEEPFEEIPAVNLSDDEDMRQTVLYLEDDYGYVVPVMKQIEWVEGIGAAAVSELVANPDVDADMAYLGLNPVLAEDTQISLDIKDGLATIQLSEGAISADDTVGEMNKVVALVNTLTEFPTIDTVFIEQAGAGGTLPSGTDISMAFSTFDLNVMSALSSDELDNASKITLYFENTAGTAIVPVTKYVGGEADAFAAMNELLRGPGDGGLKNQFPEGTKLLGVEVSESREASVNFSSEFNEIAQDAQQEKMLLKCIVLTLTQFDNIDVVRILVDGKEYEDNAQQTMAYPEFVNTLE